MNYADSFRYLESFLNLEKISFSKNNRFWNLRRMKWLLQWANHPEKYFFPVLIAGTKGKGSTGFFLESILKGNRISVGFYHSPHLHDPRERIRLNGKKISKRAWTLGLNQIRRILKRHPLSPQWGAFTYFEIMTLLAALEFQRQKVKVGIFEIGMGGRLDASNAMDAKVAIITPIHYDHEAFLGDPLTKIAGEKAEIIRSKADVIVSPQLPEAKRVIDRFIHRNKAVKWLGLRVSVKSLALQGAHQRINAGIALQTAFVLKKKHGFSIHSNRSIKSLSHGAWPGRLELIQGHPDVLLDVSHNPSSILALRHYWKARFGGKPTVLIFGCLRDKKSEKMLKILSSISQEIVITKTDSLRSQEVGVLAAQARPYFKQIYPCVMVRNAWKLARERAGNHSLVVGCGSFYLVGALRKLIKKVKID